VAVETAKEYIRRKHNSLAAGAGGAGGLLTATS
jgi:hypothetical protein